MLLCDVRIFICYEVNIMETLVKAFIQNEAGSKIKNRHNEKTLEHLGYFELEEPYPCPYGFILETTTEDGDNVDCCVLTHEKLRSGTIVECHPIGLLEVFEDGELDHKVIAVLPGEPYKGVYEALDSVRRFYQGVSKQFPTKEFIIGDFLPQESAMEFIRKFKDS